jgi:osmotically-inducible protein OsmY
MSFTSKALRDCLGTFNNSNLYKMKTDSQIQKDVMDQLKWEPFLASSAIGVAVSKGVVTLSGQVDSYSKKIAAENAAKKISGVKAIAEDIQIGVSPLSPKTDTDIAQAALNALRWHSGVQEEKVKLKVENGVIRLEGEVEWEYQRLNAQHAVDHLDGVKYVLNLIVVKPKVTPEDVKQKIISAFSRHAALEAGKTSVSVSGSHVTLTGSVRSFAEKRDAELGAWAAPGVSSVTSKIEIEQASYAMDY